MGRFQSLALEHFQPCRAGLSGVYRGFSAWMHDSTEQGKDQHDKAYTLSKPADIMSNNFSFTLITVGTGVAVVAVCSVPAIIDVIIQLSKREPKSEEYEDEDGKSTPEAVASYSARISKACILLSAITGCASGITVAILSTLVWKIADGLSVENWLSLAAWVLLLFQAIVIASSRKSVRAYRLGIYTFFSALTLAGVLLDQDAASFQLGIRDYPAIFAVRIVELVAAVCLAFAGLAIPRRPDVWFGGEIVDRMYTVSAFSRFNFSWPNPVLGLAAKKRNLDLADLPRPDHYTRSAEASANFKQRASSPRLWLSLILVHKGAFALQWSLTVVSSFLNFAPQYVIWQLLKILEQPQEAVHGQTTYGFDVWIWVVWLLVSVVGQSWIESYVWWLSWAELAVPIRSQLSSLVFEKAMRRKDVKATGKSDKKEDSQNNEAAESAEATATAEPAAANAPAKVDAEEEVDEAEALKKSKQATVNLIGVDAKRVSEFCAYQNIFPGSVFKLIVSLVFLINLLGWQALLAGFSAMLAIMPVNIYFSKRYSAAQDHLMKVRDEKLEVVTEALQGIRQIKFSALEQEWENKIGEVRQRELQAIWDVFKSDTALVACWVTSPIALSAISLAVYAILTGNLTPSVAFVSLSVFRALEMTLSVIPELTTDLLDAWVSLKRAQKYLDAPEITQIAQDGPEVAFENANLAWPSDEPLEDSERFVLRDVNVTFPAGELSVISGKTGSGKSLMLAAILGEVELLSGNLYVPRAPRLEDRHDDKANRGNWIIPNAIAYIAQIPWIENASIKDNILFGLPYDDQRYATTVDVCALRKDLEMLSDGENTEIGANGINLSGGQKWRVTLARAMYSRAGILVMDDIFSAVDAHVGRHIFEKCLNGDLGHGRTRILVTHHVSLVESKTKYLVELGDGVVLNAGLLSELREDGTLEQIKSHGEADVAEAAEARDDDAPTAVNSEGGSTDGDVDRQNGAQGDADDGGSIKKVTSKTAARKFVEEEKREEGAIKRHVYMTYLRDSGGWLFWLCASLIFLSVQALAIGRSWWLRIWTGQSEQVQAASIGIAALFNTSHAHAHAHAYSSGLQQQQHLSLEALSAPDIHVQGQHGITFYLGIYVMLALVASIINTLRFFYIFLGSVRASRLLFAKLNFRILRTPLRWLDTVPVGRILNRFTADFHIVDSSLAYSVAFGVSSFLNVAGVVVAGLFVSPYVVLLALVLLAICLYYALRYLDGARPVKRLESNMKSPVFEQFGSALTGVATIRGFDKARVYVDRMYRKLDDWATSTWHLWLFNRWMGWRMALVGSFFATFVTILILLTPGIDSALAGFALVFALEFSQSVVWAIRLYANIELNMNAAERIIEYTELQTESLDGASPPAAWPTEGRLEIDDLVVGYAPDLPAVLKGLTFQVNRNERVGVVGRTGAGKSSLTLALFRFLEARSGSIHVDGIDISTIKLHDLRSRLAIIPQDPVLFSGTVRSNLDPFSHHTDDELRDSLERVHLISLSSGEATPTQDASNTENNNTTATTTTTTTNVNIFKNLSSPISEGGLNLSQGQRQLLCLARAIVARPKVMVLDEATSAVDMTTDALIQRSIREQFGDATLLVIAHRLSTIADFDRILVLSDGRVAEFGTPRELWDKGPEEGAFRAMCEESGEKDKLRKIVFGEQ